METSREVLTAVGFRVIDDSINEEPRVPLLTGNLRGSGFVNVNGKSKLGRGAASIKSTRTKHVLTVGFDAPYAMAQHERTYKGSSKDPKAGGKYLEAKVLRNMKRYFDILKSYVKL